MLPDAKVKCPATGFTKSCRTIVSKFDCPKFVKISGTNPNDGQPVDKFGCVDSFLPIADRELAAAAIDGGGGREFSQ